MEIDKTRLCNETYFFGAHFETATKDLDSEKEKLCSWYLYVRDNWSYNPYNIYTRKEAYVASEISKRKSNHCIDKSIIFISGLRLMGIPARLHLAKVKNHISAERIIEKLGTDELAPHGYVDVFYKNKWTKASPIFDKDLCHFLNVEPLEYDGSEDSIFQEFDKEGGKFMEYLEDYGSYDDVPFVRIIGIMREVYPQFANTMLPDVEGGMIRFDD